MADWDAEEWQAFFDERAGVLQFDEGLSREQAEAIARAEVYAEKKRRRAAPDIPPELRRTA